MNKCGCTRKVFGWIEVAEKDPAPAIGHSPPPACKPALAGALLGALLGALAGALLHQNKWRIEEGEWCWW